MGRCLGTVGIDVPVECSVWLKIAARFTLYPPCILIIIKNFQKTNKCTILSSTVEPG
jgi:hypothetical protein